MLVVTRVVSHSFQGILTKPDLNKYMISGIQQSMILLTFHLLKNFKQYLGALLEITHRVFKERKFK